MEATNFIKLRLCAELQVLVAGTAIELPKSRKARAALAFLAMEKRPVTRTELCELLWEDSNDPRAALRWSISQLNSALSTPEKKAALITDRDSIELDNRRVSIDFYEIQSLLDTDSGSVDTATLIAMEREFTNNALNDLTDAGGAVFRVWLESTRLKIQQLHGRLIDFLLQRGELNQEQRFELGARWVAMDPLDDKANIAYLGNLVTRKGIRAGRKWLQTTHDRYQGEGKSNEVLLSAWRKIRESNPTPSQPDVLTEEQAQHPPDLPEQPSVAVLDFERIGSHADGEVLARGLTTDLNSRLGSLSNLFVIARASSACFKDRSLPLNEIARLLGVRYLVSGSTQRSDRKARVTVTLTDALNGCEIWSEHYDRQLYDLFEVQDDITGSVIAAIEPAIEFAEAKRSLSKPPENLNAWEYFHRGLWHSYHFMPGENETAHELFAKAIELDPTFSRAFAGLSFTHFSRAFLHTTENIEREIELALETGHASVSLDSRDSMAHWSLGRALFLSCQHDQALTAIDRALGINPNYAQGHYAKGFIGIHTGQDEQSLSFLDSAQRLSPFDPLLFAMKSSRGMSLANQGLFDEAAAWALRATHEPNAHFHIYAIATACLQLAGRNDEALNNAGWLLKRRPDYSIETFRRSFPHKVENQREHFIQALLRSGIPLKH